MTLVVKVAGGTNAGWETKRERPREAWECECPGVHDDLGIGLLTERGRKVNPPYLVACPECGTPRPKA